jgi:hypothetical protein
MDDALHATLAGWTNFYLITGTAAAALTGLQFVVQTLLASEALRLITGDDPESGIAAFGSPTVVHFTVALLLSAVLCAPWPGYVVLRETLGVLGVGALAYSLVVLRRALRQRTYRPQAEDWIWHILLPAAAYAALLLAAIFLDGHTRGPLFVLGAATLLLLCIGIHNAWDTVTWLTISAMRTAAPGVQSAPLPRKPAGKRRRGR